MLIGQIEARTCICTLVLAGVHHIWLASTWRVMINLQNVHPLYVRQLVHQRCDMAPVAFPKSSFVGVFFFLLSQSVPLFLLPVKCFTDNDQGNPKNGSSFCLGS